MGQAVRQRVSSSQNSQAVIRPIPLSSVRKDGNTQHRAAIVIELVNEYAALMAEGLVFPPIRLWWDGEYYWLADGFHRMAAAAAAGAIEISAEVYNGSQSDAQWDSYAANTAHGLRWTANETQRIVHLALTHPHSGSTYIYPNIQFAVGVRN
jgi:hypothetical protein